MDCSKQISTGRNRLSDRDMLLDLLITEKYVSRLYDQGILEATSSMISNTFERLQADTHDSARAIFAAMQQRGWYNPEQAAKSKHFSNRKQISDTFSTTADSKYAVSSGTKELGRHLQRGQRLGKSGIFTNRKTEIHTHDWQ